MAPPRGQMSAIAMFRQLRPEAVTYDPSKSDTEEVFNETRNPKRHSDAPRSGMDANDRRPHPDRCFLLYLGCDQATRAGPVPSDGADPGSVAHPVSPRQCTLRVAGRICLRH